MVTSSFRLSCDLSYPAATHAFSSAAYTGSMSGSGCAASAWLVTSSTSHSFSASHSRHSTSGAADAGMAPPTKLPSCGDGLAALAAAA